jgi:hypothetical protein
MSQGGMTIAPAARQIVSGVLSEGNLSDPARLFSSVGCFGVPQGHSGETACRTSLAPPDSTEGAMRTYLETIAMIVGLLAAYFALLPLTV